MKIAEILSNVEYPAYGDEIVSIGMDNRDVFVISDLHIAAGLNDNGNYDGTENFFADPSLFRFLHHLKTKKSPSNVRLDKTYTFLQLSKNDSGVIQTSGLMRWNDDAGRSETMELRDNI